LHFSLPVFLNGYADINTAAVIIVPAYLAVNFFDSGLDVIYTLARNALINIKAFAVITYQYTKFVIGTTKVHTDELGFDMTNNIGGDLMQDALQVDVLPGCK